MERVVAIGDIHGRDTWKRILDKESNNFDKFIFIGDYVDSFDGSSEVQLSNLLDIVEYKKSDSRIITLIGNHDFQYIKNSLQDERYSGFQSRMYYKFQEAYEENMNLFQMCYKDENNTIYSHAGISETWLNNVQISSTDPKVIVESINELFKTKPSKFGFHYEDRSGTGDNVNQSPIWIRPNSLYKDQIPFLQVVGHTQVIKIDHSPKSERRGFYMIDCLPKQYLKCVDGEFSIETLEKQ